MNYKTIQEKLRENYYSNISADYPIKKSYNRETRCECCGLVTKTWMDEEQYKKDLKTYHDEQNKLHEEFRNDCFNYYGIQNDPSRDVIFSRAWEQGHSSVYYEVFNEIDNILEFVETVKKTLTKNNEK